MSTRMRSPSYPSTSLGQAIELIGKIFNSERTNPIDRTVAAGAMGYSGVTGHSAKILSSLTQYGLLDKAGKETVRVTDRAVSILLTDDSYERSEALKAAMQQPQLFQRLEDRFQDGLPSQSALKSFLLKEGFTDAAIPPAARAYLESYEYLQHLEVCDSHGVWLEKHVSSQQLQQIEEISVPSSQNSFIHTAATPAVYIPKVPQSTDSPAYAFSGGRVDLGGAVISKSQAAEVIQFMNAVMPLLPDSAQSIG